MLELFFFYFSRIKKKKKMQRNQHYNFAFFLGSQGVNRVIIDKNYRKVGRQYF